ncbi:MAG TPA: discoidin domain-containing protein, partial [bacterium]
MRTGMSRYFHFILFGLFILMESASLDANVRLPKIFTSSMVLQQNAKINVWGWADPGEAITVKGSWSSESADTTAGGDGKWSVKCQTPAATTDGTAYTLTVSGKNKITLTGILIGEVWLLSGQSNMEIPLNGWPDTGAPIENGAAAIATANFPKMRFIIIGKQSSSTPQDNFANYWTNATWTACTPTSARWFSAIGYFFGRDLYQNLGIPIGLVLDACGGSSCEAWTSAKALEDVADFNGKGPWSPTKTDDYQTPTVLYNGMIAPIIPFTFAGVLWYQGGTNVGRAEQLTELFPAMINGWRKDWQQGDFPFYFAQLAPWGGNGGSLTAFWEAQASALSVANTGMVVTLDCGEADNIHPAKKEPIGRRFALWAKAKTYGKTDLIYSGPIYKSMTVEGDKIRLAFQYAETGLKAVPDTLRLFEIAGQDDRYVPASAQIDGQEVLVWSDSIPEPKNARYAWLDTATASLYNTADLPAAPFRTNPPAYLSSVKSSFSADPVVVRQGESSVLSWLTKGATTVTLNGESVGSAGSMQVTPDTNTTYTLVASGEAVVQKSVQVVVIQKGLTNWALNRPVTASSIETGYDPEDAVDGDVKSRWSTDYSDPQWIQIDLGETVPIERILLQWETAYGKAYTIQISDDQTAWTTLFTETKGDGGMDDIQNSSGTGRYVRLVGTER